MILSFFLIIAALVFLFVLYELGKEDFILIRKNVTLEQLFNIAFLALFFAVFSSRLAFVILHPSLKYLNPFVLVLFPYFPGLSLVGGVIGTGIFLYVYARIKRIMPGRLMDFFSLAFLACAPFAYIGYALITKDRSIYALIITPFSYAVIFLIYIKFLLSQLSKGKLKEGSLTSIFLMTFSLISLIANLIIATPKQLLVHIVENILYVLLFLLACLYVVWIEIHGGKKVKRSALI